MFNDKRLIVILSIFLVLLLANGIVLAQVYQHQQLHSLSMDELNHQLSIAELHRLDLLEQIQENRLLMESKVLEHKSSMSTALERLDFLAEENELLKKKLQ